MGAEAVGSWSLDSETSGYEKVFVGINARAIDFVKLGWLYLNEGRNRDTQVVPAAFVEEATRVDATTDPASYYQYYWWIDEDRNSYYAQGDHCQYIYVDPAADVVLIRHGRTCGDAGAALGACTAAFRMTPYAFYWSSTTHLNRFRCDWRRPGRRRVHFQ